MTRRKKLKLLQNELTAINIVIEQNNIPIKTIIRVYFNRCQMILNNEEPLILNNQQPLMQQLIIEDEKINQFVKETDYITYNHKLTETEKTAFNIE